MAADDPGSNDRFCAPRSNWELVCLEEPDHASAEASSSLSCTLEHDHSADEPCFYINKFINMDYFASPSKGSTCDHIEQHAREVVPHTKKVSLGTKEDVEFPPATSPELDWMEPSTPIRSCVIGTSEDDESSSRSCSDDSREGSAEHLLREKDVIASTGFDKDPYVRDCTAVLHDVPMDAIQESHVELSRVANDASTGGGGDEAPWRRCLGAWLTEAGRASTFCSIALAAAVIGLVIVGSGWQRVRLQYQKFRCRFFPKGKGISEVMYQLVQIKESSSKLRRIPVLKVQSCFSGVACQLSVFLLDDDALMLEWMNVCKKHRQEGWFYIIFVAFSYMRLGTC